MIQYKKFGELLTEGIKRLKLERGVSTMEATNQLLEEALGYAPPSIYHWRQGRSIPPHETILKLVELFIKDWQADRAWVGRFLKAAEYDDVSRQRLCDELFGAEEIPVSANNGDRVVVGLGSLKEPLRTLESRQFRPETTLTPGYDSWPERLFDYFRKLGTMVTAWGLLKFAGGLLIWWLSWGLLDDFFQWPWPDKATIWWATYQYAVVSLLLPFATAILLALDEPAETVVNRPENEADLWVLRGNGAYLAFHMAFIVSLFISIIIYRFESWRTILSSAWPGVLGLIILFVYVVSAQFPHSRVDTRTNQLIFYPETDKFVFKASILMGPLFALFFYFFLPDINSNGLLIIIGLIGTILIVITEQRYNLPPGRLVLELSLGVFAITVMFVVAWLIFNSLPF